MALLGALQIEKIRRNYTGGDMSTNQLLEILQNKVALGAERACRELARRMSDHKHFNRMKHKVGSRDGTLHYTIWVNNKGHHLRLDARGIVFQITDELGHDLGIVPPWVPPGS
jgi:hypothetical protein